MSDETGAMHAEIERLRAQLRNLEDAAGLQRFARFAVEHLSDAIYWMQEDASILYVNEAASRLMGYSIEELRSMKVYELNVDLDHSVWPAVWGLLKAEGSRTFEARHRRKDGRVLEVEITAHFLTLDGTEYSCAFARDIGDRKELEGRLRQAEKMEAIGRLAGGVAHDFNNQLAGIKGYGELLKQLVGDRPKALEYSEELLRLVKVAGDLTAQLLAFARQGKVISEPVDLHGLVGGVVAMLSRSMDRNITVSTELDATRRWTLGDASQLKSAVLNLALNARDAMPEGGTLTVSTRNVDFTAAAQDVTGLPPGSYVALSVRDEGMGMDAETRDHIFEPFFTTKQVGAGTGLGLAAVYGTIRNHEGGIVVESEPGHGSVFTAYLPVARPGPQDQPHREEPPGMRLRGHVMLVDDEDAVREVGTQMLEGLGCTVRAFRDGDSALAYYREHHETVDLILLDLIMPGMTGARVFEQARAIDPHVHVLLLSGYSRDGQAQELIDVGASGFLQKPFSMEELAREVGTALQGAS